MKSNRLFKANMIIVSIYKSILCLTCNKNTFKIKTIYYNSQADSTSLNYNGSVDIADVVCIHCNSRRSLILTRRYPSGPMHFFDIVHKI
jgi:hypothetical protein